MSFSVNNAFGDLPAIGTAGHLQDQAIVYFQDPAFFRLAFAKQQRSENLKKVFSAILEKQEKINLFIGNCLRGHTSDSPYLSVSYLAKDFFQDASDLEQKCELLAGSIVLVTNGDVHIAGMQNLMRLYDGCPNTVFIIWDWDNHHWLGLSTVLAAHSDVYVPAHPDNRYVLSRFNPAIAEAVTCASDQWTTPFLKERFRDIASCVRVNDPLGMHRRYDPFQYRNQVITTLNAYFPSVGFSPLHYEQKSPEMRLAEWCRHKVHWIVPVLNDIPIRLFDALITGGIPLVPDSLRFASILRDIPDGDICYYGAAEIVEPMPLVEKAIKHFDDGGVPGILRRYRYALEEHHADVRVREMIGYASLLIGVDF